MTGFEKYSEMVADSIIEYELEELKKYIRNEITDDALYDYLFNADSITGNASGSFYCNAYKAEEALCHCNDLIQEMVDEEFISKDRLLELEYVDVCARCYVLSDAIGMAVSIYQNNVELQKD